MKNLMSNKYKLAKLIVFLFILCRSCGYFSCQNYQVSYEVKFKPIKDKDLFIKEKMILNIIGDQSLFYSLNKAKIDSLVNTNNSKAARSMTSPLLRLKVYKTLSKSECSVSGSFNQFNYWYKEQPPKYSHLKKVGLYKNYSAHEASTDFGKRKWYVVYTSDIPINAGPYVFSGLPGLVIKAESLDGDYTFEMTGIKKLSETEEILKPKDNISKEKLNSIITNFMKDPASQRINFRNDMGDSFTYEFNGAKDKNYKDTNASVQKIIDQFNNYPDQEIPIITF
ncbi:MAG TPA: hypothetical protein DCQ68_13835 [Chryseobacterium indologenes]|nr:hypothetical protein [Chryseobacterium indologenes]